MNVPFLSENRFVLVDITRFFWGKPHPPTSLSLRQRLSLLGVLALEPPNFGSALLTMPISHQCLPFAHAGYNYTKLIVELDDGACRFGPRSFKSGRRLLLAV